MNVVEERDERRSDEGKLRYYNVVTTGNLLMVLPTIALIMIWGLRLEGRVDHESDLRARIELRISSMDNDVKATMTKVDDRLGKISDGIVDLKLSVVELRKQTTAVQGLGK
jgi:hypothetical protein